MDAEPAATPRAAPAGAAGSRGRTFPCEACGADLEFHVGSQRLKCPYCGHEKDLSPGAVAEVREQDLAAALQKVARARTAAPPPADTRELRCDACGATVVFQGTVTGTACAYCGASVLREVTGQGPARLPVDGLLTFAVEGSTAKRAVGDWARGLWFAPGDFKARGVAGELEGAYLPFFTFDAMTSTEYRGERGEHYTETVGSGKDARRVQRTRWFPAGGAFQRFFDDVLVPAVRKLPTALLDRLEPWPLAGCRPFTPDALAGKVVHTYDVELADALPEARRRIDAAIEGEVRARIGGDTQRIHSLRTGYAGLTYKHLLLPVWLLAYRYGGKSYRVAVNACTGDVTGERPWSAAKIALAVLAALAAAGLLAWLTQH